MKTAIVTGSTSGIGREIGLALLHRGYFVRFNYAHDVNKAIDLNTYLTEGYQGQYDIVQLDTSKFADLSIGLDKIDCLVLNVGITDRTPFSNMDIDKWNKVIDTNLTAPLFFLQRVESKLTNNSRVIFISSVLAECPRGTSLSYAVSKAGINAAVKRLAVEFALKNKAITVNAIAPGFTQSEWHSGKSDAQLERINNQIPLSRFAQSSEIASMAMQLVDNSYVTGQIINVTGGYELT